MLKIKIIWIAWYRAISVSRVLSRVLCSICVFQKMRNALSATKRWLDLETLPNRLYNDRRRSMPMISLHKPICLGGARARKIDIADDDGDDDNGVNVHYVYGLRPCAAEFIAPGKTSLLWPFYSAEETLGDYQGSLLPIDELFSSLSIISLCPLDDVGLWIGSNS